MANHFRIASLTPEDLLHPELCFGSPLTGRERNQPFWTIEWWKESFLR
jgi:hypothetical protein